MDCESLRLCARCRKLLQRTGRPINDLTGRRFGSLTVVALKVRNGSKTSWVARCDCGNERIANGKCLRSGKTTCCGCKRGRWRPNTPTDFWALVDRFAPDTHNQPLGACWIWLGARDDDGYGRFSFGKEDRAHRVAFTLESTAPPGDLFVCHRCDNPSCVRPEHLFLGSHQDNMADMAAKHRSRQPLRHTYSAGKLNRELVLQIRSRAGSHEPKRAIARALNVDEATVRRVLRGECWAHVK